MKRTFDDEVLQAAVVAELGWDSKVDATHIGVSAHDGAVTLTGYVPSEAHKVAAVRAAQRVEGVQAVADDVSVQIRLPGKITDTEIAEQIARRRNWNPEVPSTIEAEVTDGHVILRGEVDCDYQRELVERGARNLLGVREVTNEIRIARPGTAIAADVERAIREALGRLADSEARLIEVEAAAGTVRLSGRVRSSAERGLAGHAAASTPGVTTVENELVVEPDDVSDDNERGARR